MSAADPSQQAVLVVPPGALPSPVEITVEPVSVTDLPLPAVDFPQRDDLIPGTAFDFGPDGLQFAVPARLEIGYSEDALSEHPEDNLELFRVDGGVERVEGSSVDEARNLVIAEIERFSAYVVAKSEPVTERIGEPIGVADLVSIDVRPLVGTSLVEAVAVADVVSVRVVPAVTADVAEGIGLLDAITVEVTRTEPDRGEAYIALSETDSVVVVDLSTNAVVETIGVGQFPRAVTANPARQEVYVTNAGDRTVSVINTVSRLVVDTIELIDIISPLDIAVSRDGSKAYVPDAGWEWVEVIDLATRTVEPKLMDGLFGGLTATTDPNRDRLYVGNGQSIVTFDLIAGEAIDTVTLNPGLSTGDPDHVAITPDGSELWLADDVADEIRIVDLSTLSAVETITGVDGARGIAIADGLAWVVVFPSAIAPVSLSTRSVGTPIPLAPGLHSTWIAVTEDGQRAVVSEGDIGLGSRVSIVDLQNDSVLATLTVGSAPAGVAIIRND